MVDLESVINTMPDKKHLILPALKILVDCGLFPAMVRADANQLLDGRMDSDDSLAIAKEVRDHRQTNRILLGFEESAKQLTKGMDDE